MRSSPPPQAAGGEPLIMLQDYHLYLCAGMVRERQPDARLQQFVHIPWPDPDYWRLLPLRDPAIDLRRHARQRHRRISDP